MSWPYLLRRLSPELPLISSFQEIRYFSLEMTSYVKVPVLNKQLTSLFYDVPGSEETSKFFRVTFLDSMASTETHHGVHKSYLLRNYDARVQKTAPRPTPIFRSYTTQLNLEGS